jgi:hypothetical protein
MRTPTASTFALSVEPFDRHQLVTREPVHLPGAQVLQVEARHDGVIRVGLDVAAHTQNWVCASLHLATTMRPQGGIDGDVSWPRQSRSGGVGLADGRAGTLPSISARECEQHGEGWG